VDPASPSGEQATEVPAAPPPAQPQPHPHPPHAPHGRIGKLILAAVGVVYGDIGTSPLYAVRECFAQHRDASGHLHGLHATHLNVLGVLSLFFWALTLVVTVKYLVFILRADNRGEGGILSLLALAVPRRYVKLPLIAALGLFGASLLYGEGALTPAISVLSAVEGLSVTTHALEPWIVPITVAILIGLFAVQRAGTAGVGAFFGPITVVWFTAIAALGIASIAQSPGILWALDPRHAVRFFLTRGFEGFWILGSVVLCITGAEALYADMGHFGRRPIRIAWIFVVFPALLLNYFGQGALYLRAGDTIAHPFYAMVPAPLLYPMVGLATAATVIASQALITGAFSVTRQAIQLGFLPRLEIVHTSSAAEGQIFMPEVNRILAILCIALVLIFQSSSALAAAYGLSVTGTMSISSILFFLVARRWWGNLRAGLICLFFFSIDIAFFLSNTNKLLHGGYVPLVFATAVFAVMTTWKAGRDRLAASLRAASLPLDRFLEDVAQRLPPRVEGTAVFMTSAPAGTPPVLLHHFKHNKVLHQQVILLSITTVPQPVVPRAERIEVEKLPQGFWRVTAKYGFSQTPRVTDILRGCEHHGLHTEPGNTSFYLGREKLVVTKKPGMWAWRKRLFVLLSRNARSATDFFALPANRVVEMGMQIEL
jgi:KUP system potassium uptake protein